MRWPGSGADLLCYLNDPLYGKSAHGRSTGRVSHRLHWTRDSNGDMSGDALQDAVSTRWQRHLGSEPRIWKVGNAVVMSGILDLPADYNPKRLRNRMISMVMAWPILCM